MENNENKKTLTALEVAEAAVAVLIEKKAVNVKMYNVTESSAITDYYVNATGRSQTQVASLADDVAAKIAELGRAEERIEGRRGNAWLLVDYGDVIVNVFDRESREFYNHDRLMPSESLCDITHIVDEVDKKFEIKNIED